MYTIVSLNLHFLSLQMANPVGQLLDPQRRLLLAAQSLIHEVALVGRLKSGECRPVSLQKLQALTYRLPTRADLIIPALKAAPS